MLYLLRQHDWSRNSGTACLDWRLNGDRMLNQMSNCNVVVIQHHPALIEV